MVQKTAKAIAANATTPPTTPPTIAPTGVPLPPLFEGWAVTDGGSVDAVLEEVIVAEVDSSEDVAGVSAMWR